MSVMEGKFDVIVLAAGRGSDDPMAGAFAIEHKCLIPVAGTPMLSRVLTALLTSQSIGCIHVSVEHRDVLDTALASIDDTLDISRVNHVASLDKASDSVASALDIIGTQGQVLVTTADHALLSPAMVDFFCTQSLTRQADVTAGLEHADVLLEAYPDAQRTFIKFADGGYSGCNLFAFMSPQAVAAVRFWRRIERERKKPWRLVKAFGIRPLLLYLTRRLSLDQAMREASAILGIQVKAIKMPFADAAIDVDKPADLEAVENILANRAA